MSSSTVVPTSLTRYELLAASLGGALAFPTVLGLGQLAIFKPLRLTCSSPVASLCGGVSVLGAGCVASLTAVQALSLTHRKSSNDSSQTGSSSNCNAVDFGGQELLASTVASAILFRALGGRFSSVLPSHLLKPGAFAQEWIPVRSTQASERQRHVIRELGRRHGCHSCGTRSVRQFHADHQPPNKVHSTHNSPDAKNVITQRLYPQCNKCSNSQGALLSQSIGTRNSWRAIRTHPLSLRAYHLFFPIPLAIAFLKSGNLAQSSVTQLNSVSKNVSSVAIEKKTNAESVQASQELSSEPHSKELPSFQSLFGDSDLPSLIRDFPLLIIWNRLVYFLDSFQNPGDAFHITIWAFAVVAALGTINNY